MSFPKITQRQYLKGTSNRLGGEFLKRLDRGLLIDRNLTKNPKYVKTVKAPKVLKKFFLSPKEAPDEFIGGRNGNNGNIGSRS